MLMLNWISSACIVMAGQTGPLYVNTKISMFSTQVIRRARQSRRCDATVAPPTSSVAKLNDGATELAAFSFTTDNSKSSFHRNETKEAEKTKTGIFLNGPRRSRKGGAPPPWLFLSEKNHPWQHKDSGAEDLSLWKKVALDLFANFNPVTDIIKWAWDKMSWLDPNLIKLFSVGSYTTLKIKEFH